MIVRVFIWALFDSSTTIDELRDTLAPLDVPSTWLWNEASERFGALVVGDELPDGLAEARALIGREPDAFEEFDTRLLAAQDRSPLARTPVAQHPEARSWSSPRRPTRFLTRGTPFTSLSSGLWPVARSCR